MREGCYFGLFAFRFLISLRINLIVSSAVSNGPKYGPLRAPVNRAFMISRCAGVYSSLATGSFRTIVMTPPDALNSSSSPPLKPALRRIADGTTSGAPFLAITVILALV